MQHRAALFGLTLIAIGTACSERTVVTQAMAPATGADIGFELQDTQGRTVSSTNLRGRWALVFFGYASCPDICPTVLLAIAKVLAQLGPLAERVQPIFVSVDPQRDTPKILSEYVNDFDGRILALTGTPDQLDRAAKSFGVEFFKIPGSAPDNYTIAHSAVVTLLGPEGGLVMRMSTDVSADQIATTLIKLIRLDGP